MGAPQVGPEGTQEGRENAALAAVRLTWQLDDDEVANLLDAYFQTPHAEMEESDAIAEGFDEWLRDELWLRVVPGEARIRRVLREKRGWTFIGR